MTQQFTEFCCRSGGSNLNAGTLNGDSTEPGTSASFTYASGSWVSATRVFTVASGNPSSDGVAVGNFASVYPNATTTAVYIGRISARDATTITIDASAYCGVSPIDGSSNTTIKIGGAWAGPSGTSAFPLDFGDGTSTNTRKTALTDSTGRLPRLNFKNNQTYSVTSAVTVAQNSCRYCSIQGYTSTYGDLGKATLDGGATGANYALLTFTNDATAWIRDFIFQNNGNSGVLHHKNLLDSTGRVVRCVFRHAWGIGCENGTLVIECEAYDTNMASATIGDLPGHSGIARSGAAIRCFSHDSGTALGATGAGAFHLNNWQFNCIADTISGEGYEGLNTVNCDAYRTGALPDQDGEQKCIGLLQSAACSINSNAFRSGLDGWKVDEAMDEIISSRYGTGTEASPTPVDAPSSSQIDVSGYVADAVPWVDPGSGDFRITLAASKLAGRGTFTQVAASYAGTVGYPDIGAADSLGIGVLTYPGMTGGM